jgi:hypothetical protein
MKIKPYSPEIEAHMLNFYQSLSEKDRRRYAAIEAEKLGYGGISYIGRVLQCNERTITRGMNELEKPLAKTEKRIRLPGGGRKGMSPRHLTWMWPSSAFWVFCRVGGQRVTGHL